MSKQCTFDISGRATKVVEDDAISRSALNKLLQSTNSTVLEETQGSAKALVKLDTMSNVAGDLLQGSKTSKRDNGIYFFLATRLFMATHGLSLSPPLSLAFRTSWAVRAA